MGAQNFQKQIKLLSVLSAGLSEESFAEQLVTILTEVSELILQIYDDERAWRTRIKPDRSPVTAADLQANCLLKSALANLLPGVPYVSEEEQPQTYRDRQQWTRYWLVDPLDGTQEFLQRSGEFTVNVALIVAGEPLVGALAIPVSGSIYVGRKDRSRPTVIQARRGCCVSPSRFLRFAR